MMLKLLTSTLGAIAVTGQVPDLREGDCVRALEDIDYEFMPRVDKGYRGMVTGKGIVWEGRHWKFDASGPDKKYLFKERHAVIHRSMVEKMSETEGYGVIQKDVDGTAKCLTVFELEPKDGRQEQTAKLQWWDCVPGWTDQIFIYPACGFGPGQLRWAKDPHMCAYRQITKQKLVLQSCEWTQPYVFAIAEDATSDPTSSGQPNRGGQPTIDGFLKVGITETKESECTDPVTCNKDTAPSCFSIAHAGPADALDDLGDSSVAEAASCEKFTFKGLWQATDLDV